MKKDYEQLQEVVEISGLGIPELTATLVKRTDKKAMYKRWDNVWEVFRVKIDNAVTIFGRSYPKKEHYPSNEDFGVIAWNYTNEANAHKRYDEI